MVLSDPIAVTRWVNFGARCKKILEIGSLVISDPIAITCCINFGARFTKFLANVRFF